MGVTPMRYLFLMLHKFEEDEVGKWMKSYTDYIKEEMDKNQDDQFRCDHIHQHLELDVLRKRLSHFTAIRGGIPNCLYGKLPDLFHSQIVHDVEKWRNPKDRQGVREGDNGNASHDQDESGLVRRFGRFSLSDRPRGLSMRPRGSNNMRARPRVPPARGGSHSMMRSEVGKTGSILKWNAEKEYGWIRMNDHFEDNCFVHISDVADGQPLCIGTKVNFDIGYYNGRKKAINVAVVGGRPRGIAMRGAMNMRAHRYPTPELMGRQRLQPQPRPSNSRFSNLY